MVKIAEEESSNSLPSEEKKEKKKAKPKFKKRWKIEGFPFILYILTGFNLKNKDFSNPISNIITFYTLYCENCFTYFTTRNPQEDCPKCKNKTILLFSNELPKVFYEKMLQEKEEREKREELKKKGEKELAQAREEANHDFKNKIKGLKNSLKDIKKSFKKDKKNKEGSG